MISKVKNYYYFKLSFSYLQTILITFFSPTDDEGGHIKQTGYESRRQNDLYMRLGLLLGERRGARNKARDSCTSLASLDAHTLASHNTSPVSIAFNFIDIMKMYNVS